ncbi:hypothetical protein NC653_032012 [Populus alba x Populus x berolinensis]|uniref:Uncharacterized protein n=1 Tax=Populus alba x Populus x berolinensis TaxID=444605 RepID=A0AAD6Q459_9ROSI|nr:hypothetical protein NC653_032012 [Populus alba x Populus x berolinensis]
MDYKLFCFICYGKKRLLCGQTSIIIKLLSYQKTKNEPSTSNRRTTVGIDAQTGALRGLKNLTSKQQKLKGVCYNHLIMDNLGNDAEKNLIAKLDSAKSKLVEIAQMKSKLVTENNKKLFDMDIKTFGEEYKALLSDRAGRKSSIYNLRQTSKLKQLKVNVVNSFSMHFAENQCLILLDEMNVKERAQSWDFIGKGPQMMGTEVSNDHG